MALMLRGLGLTAASLLLVGCSSIIPAGNAPMVPVTPAPVPAAATAFLTGVSAGPSIGALGLNLDDGRTALASFIESCPRVLSRDDQSGLTRNDDWQAACAAAPGWPVTQAPKFFDRYFQSVQIGEGTAFATGYFEPEIAGVRTRQAGFDVPVYKVPDDLVRDWPA